MLWLVWALATKHFIVDFLLQPKWMWANKGNILHPGGWVHACLHGAVTFFLLNTMVDPSFSLALAAGETVAHYFIDFSKVQANALFGWRCNANWQFWWLMGFDQYLHSLCYITIIYWVFQ